MFNKNSHPIQQFCRFVAGFLILCSSSYCFAESNSKNFILGCFDTLGGRSIENEVSKVRETVENLVPDLQHKIYSSSNLSQYGIPTDRLAILEHQTLHLPVGRVASVDLARRLKKEGIETSIYRTDQVLTPEDTTRRHYYLVLDRKFKNQKAIIVDPTFRQFFIKIYTLQELIQWVPKVFVGTKIDLIRFFQILDYEMQKEPGTFLNRYLNASPR